MTDPIDILLMLDSDPTGAQKPLCWCAYVVRAPEVCGHGQTAAQAIARLRQALQSVRGRTFPAEAPASYIRERFEAARGAGRYFVTDGLRVGVH